MLIGIGEIDAAPAKMMIDLARLGPRWVGPIGQAKLLDLCEAGVELLVADEEGVVLRRD